MFKRRHSLKTAGLVNEEKRRKRWTQCLAFRNLQKLAAATGLCCHKQKNSTPTPTTNEVDTVFPRSHPVLKRTTTDSSTVYECDLSSAGDLRRDTLQSHKSDVSLSSREDYVEKSIECPLNDVQLQRDLSRVADRLHYLLNLSDNGNTSDASCPKCSSTESEGSRDTNGRIRFSASWDEATSSLLIKLVPSTRSRASFDVLPRLERLDSGLGSSRLALSPCSNHPRLSARISTDSGFFSTFNFIFFHSI